MSPACRALQLRSGTPPSGAGSSQTEPPTWCCATTRAEASSVADRQRKPAHAIRHGVAWRECWCRACWGDVRWSRFLKAQRSPACARDSQKIEACPRRARVQRDPLDRDLIHVATFGAGAACALRVAGCRSARVGCPPRVGVVFGCCITDSVVRCYVGTKVWCSRACVLSWVEIRSEGWC